MAKWFARSSKWPDLAADHADLHPLRPASSPFQHALVARFGHDDRAAAKQPVAACIGAGYGRDFKSGAIHLDGPAQFWRHVGGRVWLDRLHLDEGQVRRGLRTFSASEHRYHGADLVLPLFSGR